MHILLDTHVYLWWLNNDKQLSKKARSIIIDADLVYISSITIWEAAIKIQLGKLDASINALVKAIESEGFLELPITAKHAEKIIELPAYHKDPFDRMLVAQCVCEPLRLLTGDTVLRQYTELVDLI